VKLRITLHSKNRFITKCLKSTSVGKIQILGRIATPNRRKQQQWWKNRQETANTPSLKKFKLSVYLNPVN